MAACTSPRQEPPFLGQLNLRQMLDKHLEDLLGHLKAKQDMLDENALAWQRRLESKMDQQLALSQQLAARLQSGVNASAAFGSSVQVVTRCQSTPNGISNGTLSPNSGNVLPGKVQSAWHDHDSTPGAVQQLPGTSPAVHPEAPASSEERRTSRDSKERNCSKESAGVSEAGSEEQHPDAFPIADASLQFGEAQRSKTHRPSIPSGAYSLMGTSKIDKQRTSALKLPSDKKQGKKKKDHYVLATRRLEVANAQSMLQRITSHKLYEAWVITMILCNSFWIGWQVQVVAQRVEKSFLEHTVYDTRPPTVFLVGQTTFAFLFSAELGMRLAAEGLSAFFAFEVDLPWNVFDVVTVVCSLVELIFELAEPDSMIVASISVIRVLRVLRIVRLVKLIRVYPFFHELRMMVESCLNSLKSYLWCIMVLLLMTYVFGISMTTGTIDYLSAGNYRLDAAESDKKGLQEFFGTVDKSMLSLFQTSTGGRDWNEFYEVLDLLDSTKRWIFLIYISFAMFAVCNVIAAVFVESAMQSSAHDRELLIREQLRDSQAYQEKMMGVFQEMDADGTGTITLDEFTGHLNDDRVIAYFNSMKLDVSDATNLFKLLDVDRSGSVEIMEFIEGCQKLKGESRTLDMHLMRYELHSMRHEMHQMTVKFLTYAEMTGVKGLADMEIEAPAHLETGPPNIRMPESSTNAVPEEHQLAAEIAESQQAFPPLES